jgi:bidirectional [NiFe] hydrogenase diaphorase subunit
MEITIDSRKIEAAEGETILSVARRAGIDIPTLCHHDALEPVGACRVCVVEISQNGWKRVVTSCQFPVRPGLEVWTDSERVRAERQTVLSLLVARCPGVAEIRAMAERHGGIVPYKTFDAEERCILCYRCTRACAAVGPEAISAVGRGQVREIAPPFHGPAEACIGCGACYRICPTQCIEMRDTGEVREIWGRRFELSKCAVCGKPTITKAYRDYVVNRHGLDESYFDTCAACKSKEAAERFATVGAMLKAGE